MQPRKNIAERAANWSANHRKTAIWGWLGFVFVVVALFMSAQVVEQFLTGWAGRHRYVHNRPPLPLVDNMNRAIELASGDWVMQLDDDDYLLPGAVAAMVKAIERSGPGSACEKACGRRCVGCSG